MRKTLTVIGSATDFINCAPDIPLYLSPVQAGFPSPAEDYVETRINLHEILVRHPDNTFFLRAAGDSMIGVGINDGDLLVVDRSVDAASGRVVIAAIDGELLVKTLVRKKGKALLVPANPEYPVIDITLHDDVHIWGVVVWVIHKL